MRIRKAGIIGCGSIAQVHGVIIGEMEDTVLAAICDKDRAKAESFRRSYGQGARGKRGSDDPEPVCYTDWRDLLDADLDVVHLCTPHYLHAPMAVELLEAGKAVFMEKPCAISMEQFKALKQADASHPGKLGICFQNRYNAATGKIDSLVRDGAIGRLTGGRAFVTWRRDEDYYAGSDWKGKLATEGGGALINQSIHTLDLLLRYLGEPDAVEATMTNHHLKGRIEVEDTLEAWLTFPGGRRACFYCSNGYAADAPVMLELQGEAGRILMAGGDVTVWNDGGTEHYDAGSSKGIGKDYWGDGHRACIKGFYDCVARGARPVVDLMSAENTFRTMMRIYESGRENG